MSEEETIIDHLEGLLFFNQRAGRELWFDKPKEVQDRDIVNAERHLQEAIGYIRTNQQKQGHWIANDDYDGEVYYTCSRCEEPWVTIEGTPQENRMKYCPSCGAMMKGEVK